jgi:hypothetical protein
MNSTSVPWSLSWTCGWKKAGSEQEDYFSMKMKKLRDSTGWS